MSDRQREPLVVVTSALSLARQLWRYGEPALAEQALALSPDEVATIGHRSGSLVLSGDADRLWPDGPADKAAVLAVTERLEGAPRRPRRARRLPEERLPAHLQATEAERWQATTEVAEAVDRRRHGGRIARRSIQTPDIWPDLWQPEAIEAVRPYIDADARLSILVGDPATAISGTLIGGYVYVDEQGKLKTIYDRSGRRDVYPWGLLSGPVLRVYLLRPGKRRQLLYAHPDWTEPERRSR
jgi:hypothetical protein